MIRYLERESAVMSFEVVRVMHWLGSVVGDAGYFFFG